MLLTKSYYKWESDFEDGPYKLGEQIRFPNNLEIIGQEQGRISMKSAFNNDLTLVVESEVVIRKVYKLAGESLKLGKLYFEKNFQNEVEKNFNLSTCQKEDNCDKLTLCYIDGILNLLILDAAKI